MSLSDKYLPNSHFHERHALDIAATQAEVIAAALCYKPDSDLIFKCAIAARGLPMRLFDLLKRRKAVSQAPFSLDNFTMLEQNADQELAFGLAGKFWMLNYGQSAVKDGAEFLAFKESGAAKLVLSFKTEQLNDSHTQLSTETRVFCLDKEARRKFTPYRYLIRPVSGLLRRRILASIRQDATDTTHPSTTA
ncbi:hypothetical protein GCM10010096_17310 [Alcaligenes pakistanensis]|uniref:DUF2867 domain-containing protein n=1 Tax=Alcaligenes pakistanensis TaxID=1482717 RepID=A0A8H9IHC9_9BURK|nr:hypothetical protein [Alcaligenes pakistanensis]GHC46420.1 hypothetical protein GCM10010096_17310 [Alcaligenes pakistanensis]